MSVDVQQKAVGLAEGNVVHNCGLLVCGIRCELSRHGVRHLHRHAWSEAHAVVRVWDGLHVHSSDVATAINAQTNGKGPRRLQARPTMRMSRCIRQFFRNI